MTKFLSSNIMSLSLFNKLSTDNCIRSFTSNVRLGADAAVCLEAGSAACWL